MDSFLLDLGLNILTFLNNLFAIFKISLKLEPIKILETKKPFFLIIFFQKFIASRQSSPVANESKFLFPVVFGAISDIIISIFSSK